MEIINVKTGLLGGIKNHPLGKYPRLSPKFSEKIKLTYLLGEEIIDSLFEKNELHLEHEPKSVKIINHPNGLEFITSIFMEVNGELLILKSSNILSWSIHNNPNLIKKSKSVLGRSIAGALIAGPVGSVIGGISGLGEKSLNHEYLLTILYNLEGNLKSVVFGCKESKVKKLLELMRTEYSKLENIKLLDDLNNNSESITSKLNKYTELLDKGLITEDDFLKLKRSLFD